jgi:hypothetical protein
VPPGGGRIVIIINTYALSFVKELSVDSLVALRFLQINKSINRNNVER